MSLTKLRTIDVKGKKFDVSVSVEGKFFAEFDHEQISADSLKQLTDKLGSRIAHSKRVNIPICMWEKQSWNDDPAAAPSRAPKEGTLKGETMFRSEAQQCTAIRLLLSSLRLEHLWTIPRSSYSYRPEPKSSSLRFTLILNGAVRVYPDGREVCQDSPAGWREYKRRVEAMLLRQGGRCCLCGKRLALSQATFEHQRRRGIGAAWRQDAVQDKDGNPINGAAHSIGW